MLTDQQKHLSIVDLLSTLEEKRSDDSCLHQEFSWQEHRVIHDRFEGIDHCSLSVSGSNYMVNIESALLVSFDSTIGLLVKTEGRVIYFPVPARQIRLDKLGRIREFDTLDWNVDFCESSVCIRAKATEDAYCEIVFLSIAVERQEVFEQLFDSIVDSRLWAIEGCWTNDSGPAMFWRYVILGQVYSGRFSKFGRFPSPQTAWSLFKIAQVLWRQTQNRLFCFQMVLLAHVELEGMNEAGTWGNGEWLADSLETHLRFHNDGINLLVSAYHEFGNEAFLEGARQAGKYLLAKRDEFDAKRWWYLHDALELAPEHKDLPAPRLLHSNRLGKNRLNTLTLNTHVQAVIVLSRLHEATDDVAFLEGYQNGVNGLRAVFENPDLRLPQRLAERILLISLERQYAPSVRRALRSALRSRAVPRLTYLQRFAPSFSTPGGYLWRDQELPLYGYWYHLVNLYDLLILDIVAPDLDLDLDALIESAISFAQRSGLVEWLLAQNHYIYPQWLQILHVAMIVKPDLVDAAILESAVANGNERGYGVPPELFVEAGFFEQVGGNM